MLTTRRLGRRLITRHPGRGVLFAAVLLLSTLLSVDLVVAQDATIARPTLYVFVQEGCPSCERMKPFIRSLDESMPELRVRIMEVSANPEYRRVLIELGQAFGVDQLSVPAVFIGDRGWVGYSEATTQQIAEEAARCVEEGCDDALEVQLGIGSGDRGSRAATVTARDVPEVFGLQPEELPIVAGTALVAFLDGFNPCSLWVLTFLLAMVMHTGSRRRVLLVGGVFLLVTAAIYGLFIVGIVQAVVLVAHVTWIRIAVVALALAMGAINIKDYFAFKQGMSLTLSARRQSKIARRFGELGKGSQSTGLLIVTTAGLAAGIAIVELPCTAGFPVVWSNMIANANVGFPLFALLLGLYLFIYLLIELVIVVAATVAFKRVVITERAGRVLKLLGGSIMVALAIVLLFRPELMDSIGSMLVVFAAAAALSLLLALIERFLPARPTEDGAP
ncbi:MAG TPA: glutaredoxin domain-containing protein [Spirochaetia bacterium]|nr:glutaredoxin domain-containing protein [Spirochaetia bacterium]